MRTASSPSLISISAMPDSSSSSISFLIFRMSMPYEAPLRLFSSTLREVPRCRAHRELVARLPEPRDVAQRDVAQIRVATERLPGLRIREMHLDERHAYREQRIAQRDARVREGPRVQDDDVDPVARRALNGFDQRGFGVTLQGREVMTQLPGESGELALDRGQRIGPVDIRF